MLLIPLVRIVVLPRAVNLHCQDMRLVVSKENLTSSLQSLIMPEKTVMMSVRVGHTIIIIVFNVFLMMLFFARKD